MRQTDVAIVGGGLAGSLAAAMLGRAGIDAILVDPHPVYPSDFRCEKLDADQLRTLRLTGLADAVLTASTADREFWVARFGRVIERRPGDQRGVLYDTLVNTLRAQIPGRTEIVRAKVKDIANGSVRQVVTLSTGEEIAARLVVIATGLNPGLHRKLGLTRTTISPAHSISIGFDLQPPTRLPFTGLTYYAEHPADRMAYITLLPIGTALRANLFGYRDPHDPWLRQFRAAPRESLDALWPGLRRLLGDYAVSGFVHIRPIDLDVTTGYGQDGIVLVGDAFSTSCPAAGNGARKVLVDVERLCNIYIPRWLATPGMDVAKMLSFYDDPIKHACDTRSERKAFELRSTSIDASLRWTAMRWARFGYDLGRGILRRLRAGGPADDLAEPTDMTVARWAGGAPPRE